MRPRSEARRLSVRPQESEQAVAEISEYTIFCGENWIINTLEDLFLFHLYSRRKHLKICYHFKRIYITFSLMIEGRDE